MRLECGTFFNASTYSPSGRLRSPSMVSSSKLNSLRFCALAAAASAEVVADLSCAAATHGIKSTTSIQTLNTRPNPRECLLVSIYIEWRRPHQTPTSLPPPCADHTPLQLVRTLLSGVGWSALRRGALGRVVLRVLETLLLQLLRLLQRLGLLLLHAGLRLGCDQRLGLAAQRKDRRVVGERGLAAGESDVLLVELERLVRCVLVPLQHDSAVQVDGGQLGLELLGSVVFGERLVRLSESAVRHTQVQMDLGGPTAVRDRTGEVLLGAREIFLPEREPRERQSRRDEARVRLERLLVLDRRLVRSALRELHVADGEVQVRVGGGDLQRAHAHQLGHRELLPVEVAPEERLVGVEVLGIADQRLARHLLGAIVIAAEPAELGELGAALGVIGEGAGGVVPLREGRGQIPLGAGEAGEPLGGGLQGRLLLQRRAVEREGLVALALTLGEDPKVVVGFGKGRIGLLHGLEA